MAAAPPTPPTPPGGPAAAAPAPGPSPDAGGPRSTDPHPALVVARKLGAALLALVVFVFAIELLKTGAQGVGPVLRDVLRMDHPINAFGFGWFMAYVVLSGSPIAATALGMFKAQVLDAHGLYAMIAGSRFGAAFIVLFVGFLYTLRTGTSPRKRRLSLEAGVLSLLVTWTVYGPGVLVGLLLLRGGFLDGFAPETPPALLDLIEATLGALAVRIAEATPHDGLLFPLGIASVVVAFKLFDLALPDIQRRAGRLGRMAERIYRPTVVFAFGFLVTMLTLSVSVSLSLLVPLTLKGVIRRENLIPYIMGANVGTFLDTLFASIVVGGAEAFTVVLAEMVGVALVSLAVLAVGYSHYEDRVYRAARGVLASRGRMALFLTVILICPLVLSLL